MTYKQIKDERPKHAQICLVDNEDWINPEVAIYSADANCWYFITDGTDAVDSDWWMPCPLREVEDDQRD